MESQVREHQIQLRRRLESIKRIHKASDTLDDRLDELKHVQDGMAEQSQRMSQLVANINTVLETTLIDRLEDQADEQIEIG